MKQSYLNEEKYQKNKKLLMIIATIILLLSIIGSTLLIITGINRSNSVNKPELEAQINEEFFKNGFSQRHNELEEQLHYAENAMFFYVGGAFIILFGVIISSSLFLTAKKREITAFKVQQVMPIAQEGIDKIAPTMGNAAKEIAKVVKEGMQDDEKSRD